MRICEYYGVENMCVYVNIIVSWKICVDVQIDVKIWASKNICEHVKILVKLRKIVENGSINSNVIVWIFCGQLARTLSDDDQTATCSQNNDACHFKQERKTWLAIGIVREICHVFSK